MAYTVTIGGVSKVIQPGWSFTEMANGRNILSCKILSLDASYRPAARALFTFNRDATRIFGGTIQSPNEGGLGGYGVAAIETSLSIIDNNAIADRRFVSGIIAAGTLRSQLEYLRTNYLNSYGLNATVYVNGSSVTTGPAMSAIPCSSTKLSELLNQISVLSGGYIWDIDYNLILRANLPASTPAPFNILNEDGNVEGDISVEPDESNYANRITVRFTSTAITAWGFLLTTGNFINGETVTIGSTVYTMQTTLVNTTNNILIGSSMDDSLQNIVYAVEAYGGLGGIKYGNGTAVNPAVTAYILRSGMMKVIARTAGASGNSIAVGETCANASWITEGGGIIAALTFGADEELTERVEANNVAEQTANGIWEFIYDESSIYDYTIAQTVCDAYLARAVVTPKTIHYSTFVHDIHPGQIQTITVTKRNLTGSYLITDVRAQHIKGERVLYTITAVGGVSLLNRWQDDAKRLFSGSSGSGVSGGGISITNTTGNNTSWYFLGGSLTEWVQSPVPEWISASGIQILIDTTVRGSIVATVYVRLRAIEGTVTARLRDLTSNVTVGTSIAVASTTFVTVSFLVTLTAGLKLYELQLSPSLANVDVNGVGYLE